MFWLLIADRGFVLIAGEDACWHRLSVGRRLHQRVGRLVETPRGVIELEAIELVLQLADFSIVCSHLGIVVARLLHDLVSYQLGVALDIEASDAQLDGNAQAVDECLIFGHIVGGREMDADHVPHAYPEG